ncbi:MAG: hypothetical protein AAF790_14770 [Planctomycetota bacterium]
MPTPPAKAMRCESCGAALSPDKPTCDYCGSHHNLPAYRAEGLSATPARTTPRRAYALWMGAAAASGAAAAALVWRLMG